MKLLLILFGFITMTGCATHANISMPAVVEVQDKAYENKSIRYKILYSQPKPGVFNEKQQQPLKPIEQAELSVGSARVLKDLPTYIKQQLPKTVKVSNDKPSDLELIIELYAFDKKGPAYADFEFGKSLGKSLLTFGLGSSEYEIIADFNVKYILRKNNTEVFSKTYEVKDQADHERSKLGDYKALDDFSSRMLEKHLILTLNDFLKTAAKKM